MPRYGTRCGDYVADWWFATPLLPAVQAPETKPVETGLVDHRGHAIVRLPEPVGFHKPKGRA